jgi:hypothetical protein
MPAHIGAFTKLKVFGAFLSVNLNPSGAAKNARKARITTRAVRDIGVDGATNNRAEYVPWKYVMRRAERGVREREAEYAGYGTFRRYLDGLDPALPREEGADYTDPQEWNLYLRPGTEFDGRCQLYFAAKRGSMCVIRHNGDRRKLKRIEAVPRDGAPVILWTDAS